MSIKSFITQKTSGVVSKASGALGNATSAVSETAITAGKKLACKAIMNDKKTAQATAAAAALEAAGFKTAGQNMSVEDAARLAGTLTGHGFAVEAAITAGKTAKDAVDTASVLGKKGIFDSKSIFAQVRENGQVTQDMLDAVLCDNKEKLAQAYREAIRAEALGKPLPYLSKDEVDSALSLRKSLTKSVTRKFFS